MLENRQHIYPVLLAGGAGTRLWPVSRELYPKQLVSFIDKDSLVQGTIRRLAPVLEQENVRIVCGQEHAHETNQQLADVGLRTAGKIIPEPCGRNTGPAILLALLKILREDEAATLFVFPADHVIRDIECFQDHLVSAALLAERGFIVTFGIQPSYPETGYGYIEGKDAVDREALTIARFVEKPDRDTAAAYIRAGNFFWNSGMFAFKGSVMIDEYRRLAPDMLQMMTDFVERGGPITEADYRALPSISFDYAIMEKTSRGVVLPSGFGWSDIGSWKSLYDFLPKDENNNVIKGDVMARNATNCFILGYERLIAANHLENVVIVETPDSIFVSDIENSRDVKEIVNALKHQRRKEYQKHNTESHPWGRSTQLENKDGLNIIKRHIKPGEIYRESFEGDMLWHVLVAAGSGMFMLNGRRRAVVQGDSETMVNPRRVSFENTSQAPLLVVETRVASIADM